MPTVRERSFEIERLTLSPRAILSENTKGREHPDKQCDIRTPFQVDRDRIIHCNSFRRLKHKTQVFLAPSGDHYRTRLTHTLEVAQIARTIARALRLNEDLTEAIALGHDLGHTPFGHAGERALDSVSPFGFKHYEQSVRVVEKLEKGGRGLNLTYEVKDGIMRHTCGELPQTLEGQAVRLADRIAYINHDIDDALRGGILKNEDIPLYVLENIGDRHSKRIDKLVRSVVENSDDVLKLDPVTGEYFDRLHDFMFERVYTNNRAKSQEGKAGRMIVMLYEYFVENTDLLPTELQEILKKEGKDRAVCDYIAGMTDLFATNVFTDIFVPRGWQG